MSGPAPDTEVAIHFGGGCFTIALLVVVVFVVYRWFCDEGDDLD